MICDHIDTINGMIAGDNPEHRRRRALSQLERLGYPITLEPAAA